MASPDVGRGASARPDLPMLPDDYEPEPGPASQDRGAPGHDLAEASARRAQAVTMRLSGLTYEQIAERLGYADKSAVRHTVLRALDRREAARVDELRDVENARLDRANAALWPAVLKGDPKSVDTFIRLSARRARLNGLDAPQQIAVTSGLQADFADTLAGLQEVVLGEVVHLDEHGQPESDPGEPEEA
jgi:hypothetical protein